MMVSVLKKEKVLPALTLTCLLIATLSVSVVPTKASTLQPHQPILINGNNGFTSANGVVQGSGSLQDPYLISGWDINSSSSNGIAVGNTTANFAIRNVNVHSKTAAFIGVSIDHARYAALENSPSMATPWACGLTSPITQLSMTMTFLRTTQEE